MQPKAGDRICYRLVDRLIDYSLDDEKPKRLLCRVQAHEQVRKRQR